MSGFKPFDPSGFSASDIAIERIIDGQSTAASQLPAGLGPSNAIQIEFGPAQNGPSDPVELSALGAVTFNQDGLYRIKVSLQIARTSSSGTAVILIRVLGDGVQLGRSVIASLPNANVIRPYQDETWINIASGTVLTFECMRDSAGNDDGGLLGQDVTVEPGSWNQDVCAEVRVERWVG